MGSARGLNEDAPNSVRAPAVIPALLSSRPRVLCIDDSPTCLRLVQEILVRNGCDVVCATDAAAALAQAGTRRFDVVVTDHDMPGMNGVALVGRLRAIGYAGKVAVVSASVGASEQSVYRQLGVTDFVVKPLVGSMLLKIVFGG